MDVLITFDDGATELRDDVSHILERHRWVDYQRVLPPVDAVIDVRPYYSDGCGMRLVTAGDRFLDTCAATVQLSARRGDRGWAWCITGQDPETRALTGEWRGCKVESKDEQIARLTRERDAERARAEAYVQSCSAESGRTVAAERRCRELEQERETTRASQLTLLWMEGVQTNDVSAGIGQLGTALEKEVRARQEAHRGRTAAEQTAQKATADAAQARWFEQEYHDDIGKIQRLLRKVGVDEHEEVERGGFRRRSLAEQVQTLADMATAQTFGDLINARARAGAALAEARDALGRIPKSAHLIREVAEQRVTDAATAFTAARQAEATACPDLYLPHAHQGTTT